MTVKIPYELAIRLDEIMRDGDGGYGSRAEIIKDAVRRFSETRKVLRAVPRTRLEEPELQTH